MIYAWIWNHLPGTTALRLLQILVLVAVVVAVLYTVVFPWIDHSLQLDYGAVG